MLTTFQSTFTGIYSFNAYKKPCNMGNIKLAIL